MITISERLRARQEPVGDGSGKWRKDGLCQEAAEIVDALVAALEDLADASRSACIASQFQSLTEALFEADYALAKAKGKQE